MEVPVTEWKLFTGDVPYVSTLVFHADRERAPHLEQEHHRERLHTAAGMIAEASKVSRDTFTDLGCGDGGLLSLVQEYFNLAWGYDFAPANRDGWKERGVTAYALDFTSDMNSSSLGQVIAMTEVLEHLARPHEMLARVHANPGTEALVCSSPWNENAESHDECHAWAWDADGYRDMIEEAGWTVREHVILPTFQVVSAEK